MKPIEESPYLTRDQVQDEIFKMNNSLAIACQGPLGSSTTFLDEKQCTLPRENTFANNQYGVLLELNGQTLSSDLQVLREISGYAGTLNAGASDIMVDDYGNEMASNLNEFDLSFNADKARDPFLGQPTDERVQKMNMIDDTTVYMANKDPGAYVIPRPTFKQVKELISKQVWQPLVVGAEVSRDAICACQLGNTTPIWGLRAVQMSSYNHQKLFKKLKEANILSHVEKLIVYPPNGQLCMCSWIGTDLAGRFATFTERLWERRARQEIDLERRIDDENEEFVKQVVMKIEHIINQRTVNTYATVMKKRAWERHDPVEERLAPSIIDSNPSLQNSNFVKYFGPEALSNPDMAGFVRGLTNPWGKGLGLNEKAKKELGIDFSRHADPSTINASYG
jgi:hypothetical protein